MLKRGLEPPSLATADSKSAAYTIPPLEQWRIGDSNPSPPPCKGGALPNELIPQINSNI